MPIKTIHTGSSALLVFPFNHFEHTNEEENEENAIEERTKSMAHIVPPEGVEPPTFRLEGDCSIR